MKHTDTIALQGSIADMRKRIAAEQAAMHKVRLGVARWHAEAQCHFMCWLEQGGFAHADADADAATDNVSAPAMADTPPDTGSTATAPARQAATPPLPAHCNGCAA